MESGNLLENQLFLSLLSNAGANIAGEGSMAAEVFNPTVQSLISAKNKTKEQDRQNQLIAKLLGQGVDFKSDAKGNITVSGDVATMLGGGQSRPSDLGTVAQPTNPQSTNVQQPNVSTGLSGGILNKILNPSSSPSDVSYSDLVGLTPQDISDSLAGAVSVANLKRQSINDVTDRMYKRALVRQANASAAANEPSVTIPGTDIQLTRKQYVDWYKAANKDDRTAAIKNYEYAVGKGYGGSFESFQDSALTSQQKNYNQAKGEGYKGGFNKWLLEMTKAGALNIGDIVKRKEATKDVDSIKYFTDPKGLAQDVSKYISSEDFRRKLFKFNESERDIETVREKEKFIVNKIISSGGEIVDQKLEGRTFVWKVKWPNGKVSEVKYAN